MRISDWSSDVCSSDLKGLAERGPEVLHRVDLLPLALHANDYSIIFSHTLKIKHIKTPNRNPLRSTLISRSGNSAALPPFDWGWQRSIGGGAAVCPATRCRPADRESVVWGTSVSVRVDLVGRRLSKKKTKKEQ